MKRLFTLFSLSAIIQLASAQDAAMAPPAGSINAPVSGCSLTGSEVVRVTLFNFGPGAIVPPFNLSYTITGPIPTGPIVEIVPPGPGIPANTAFTYTFTTTANMSAAGTYTVSATVTVAGDPNAANNTYSNYIVVNSAPSVGGSIAPALSTVCSGANSGTLTLSGQTGSVLSWEYSIDGGNTWNSISNTTTTQNYNNLTSLTIYHAKVKNGSCAAATSANAIVTVTSPSAGGSVSPSATVCSGSNSGTLTLSGHTGTVQNWEYSTDGGITWSLIANTTTSQSYTNLTTTTMYHTVVQNGSCAPAISSPATITVSPVTIGGTASPSATVCAPINTGTLTLAGQTGTVLRWEYSTNGGATWTPDLTNTSTSYTYNNLTITTMYRAVVQSGACAAANSSTATITVTPATVGGSVTSNATVCSGSNSGTLTLGGQTGSVLSWQYSTDGGVTWTAIGNVTTTQNYTNITITTMYRAVVRSGACTTVNSNPATITVNPATVGGTTSANAVVCSGNNNGTITLTGQTGNVIRWEYSTDGGFNWLPVNNTTTSFTYNDITVTTMYRAVVQSSPCNAANSSSVTIQVTSPSRGGNVAASATVCAGSSGTLTLSGQTGNVQSWEFSTNSGVTWNAISNTTPSQTYTNITMTTWYRSLVRNGTCPQDTSSIAILTVSPASAGGTLVSNATVCRGNNSGTLTLSGQTGSIIRWEYSVDGGNTWVAITNTTASQSYLNLTQTTLYHAVVQSGACGSVNSNNVTITVTPPSVGGMVASNASVCGFVNNGTLTLSTYTGSILSWISSTDGGITWTSIVNTTSIQNYVNLTQTTMYAAVVGSGVCANDTSGRATITVYPSSAGGTVSSSATVCSGSNNGTLTLSGQTGSVLRWEYSTDGGNTWVQISNTGNSQVYNNLTTTTLYHAVVQSGSCPIAASTNATITVTPASVAGTISPQSSAVCAGQNMGTLTLSGYAGTILSWSSSTDGGITWIPTGITTDTLQYTNLTITTMYHVTVQSGTCAPAISAPVTVTVRPKPVANFIVPAVCFGAPSLFTSTSTISSGTIQSYQWDFGDLSSSVSQNPLHLYAAAGNYPVLLTVISNYGCRDTITRNARVNPRPLTTITVTGSLQFCQGDSVLLAAPANANYLYAWNTGSTASSIYVKITGSFAVTITDSTTGCTATSSTVNTTMNLLPVITKSNDTTIKLGESVTLWANGGTGATYSWVPFIFNNPLIASPTATPSVTTTFTVYVTSTQSCRASATVKVMVDPSDPQLVISNMMTPNGDGYNESFYIEKIIYYPNNELSIFNRNGQLVYSTTNYQNTWHGTYNDQLLPDGTYYYVLKLPDYNKTFKGSITILTNQ